LFDCNNSAFPAYATPTGPYFGEDYYFIDAQERDFPAVNYPVTPALQKAWTQGGSCDVSPGDYVSDVNPYNTIMHYSYDESNYFPTRHAFAGELGFYSLSMIQDPKVYFPTSQKTSSMSNSPLLWAQHITRKKSKQLSFIT
jgi:hypothetical protein